MSTVIGILATTASLAIALLGLPAQIVKNNRRKNCDGLSLPLICTVFCSYSFWSIYGWTKPDLLLVIAQTPGSVLSLIIIFQFFHYQKKIVKRSHNIKDKKQKLVKLL
jgi:uncharacterized protein with PQ loop repeat